VPRVARSAAAAARRPSAAKRELRGSYPDFCIKPPPPDLNCADISATNFRVRWDVPDPDPHHFDGNRDGVGCES
jgi:micrococcal nuclease